MRAILSGQRGLAPAVLVVVVAWALAAVLMLTGTLVAARRIHRDVQVITPEVSDISTNSRAVALATKTAAVSAQIATAAGPLSGHLAATLTAAHGINRNVTSILGRARTINATALSIGRKVDTIHEAVASIGAAAASIDRNARSINASAHGIGASARAIRADVTSVHASAVGIRGRATAIRQTTGSIDRGLADINARAVRARRVVLPIGADIAAILPFVRAIDAHANGIDCSRLINSAGATTGCRR